MTFSSISRMAFSPEAAWPDLERVDSTAVKTFSFLVVPLSLLPPAMIFWAGSHHGDAFVEGLSSKPWALIAAIFFLCEIVSVSSMGWLIKQVAHVWKVQVSYRNAYILAAIAAIPLWVSSLGLFVASMAFNIALSIVALIFSFALLLQGVRSFCKINEYNIDVALAITRLVFGAGLGAWGFMLLLLII
ncbi:MAG: YIP1 family protein [Sterolibacterium sp.]